MAAGSENANILVSKPKPPSEDGPETFEITRVFDVSREKLWSVWTEEQHLKRWFGPNGFTIPVCKLNLVPGGVFHYCMRAPNGVEMWGKWIFQEIAAPERIVLVNTFSNKHGNLTRHPYVPDWPLEMLTTTTLTAQDGKTLLKIAWVPMNASAAEEKTFESMHEAMTQGWNGTFDQLTEYMSTL